MALLVPQRIREPPENGGHFAEVPGSGRLAPALFCVLQLVAGAARQELGPDQRSVALGQNANQLIIEE